MSISYQVLEDFVSSGVGSRFRCILIPEWFISKSNGEIVISGFWGDLPLPRHPRWIDFSIDSDSNFSMSMPSDTHIYECIGLLYETWRSQQHSNQSIQHLLTESLTSLRSRWQQVGEPLDIQAQMRLIGEIIPLVEAIGIFGKEALDSWDAEGRALYDIEAESWIIEAKATRSDPERVWLSDPEQVNWRIHKPILLAVTRMNRDRILGDSFPNIIEELISTLSTELQSELRLLLLTVGLSPELNMRYSTKWVIHGTRYLPISDESPVLDSERLQGRPNEVISIKYQLETQNMPEIDLGDFLPR